MAFAFASAVLAVGVYRSQADHAIDEAAIRARGAAADVDRYIASRWSALLPIAASPALLDGDVAEARALLDHLDADAMGFDGGIGYIDSTGWQRARTGGYTGPPIDFSEREHVRRALATGLPTVSSAFEGAVNPSPLVAFAVPVRDDSGRVTGIVGGGLRLDTASIGPDSLRYAGGSQVAILDRNGRMVAGPGPVTELAAPTPASPSRTWWPRARGQQARRSAPTARPTG